MIRATAPVWCRCLGNYAAATRSGAYDEPYGTAMAFKTPRAPNPNVALLERRGNTLPPRRNDDGYTFSQIHNARSADGRDAPALARVPARRGAARR